jgi:aspartyl protease family protein
MAPRARPLLLVRPTAALLAGLLAALDTPAEPTVAARLHQLAQSESFTVTGLEKIEPGAAPVARGAPLQQIRRLLAGYDYVIVHTAPERIERLIIMGKKRAPPAAASQQDHVLPTRREGEHHFVQARVLGTDGKSLQLELMVDTGSSLLVLPESRASDLDQALEGLENRAMETANGTLEARIGRVAAVELGDARVEDVEVAFVPDDRLAQPGLLGMNVLSRFLFVLDDERNELTLVPDVQAGDTPPPTR